MHVRANLLRLFAVAMLGGAASPATAVCDVSLVSLLPNAQALLKATCGGVTLKTINWHRDVTTSLTGGDLPISPAAAGDVYFTTSLIDNTHSYTATATDSSDNAVNAGLAATITTTQPVLSIAPTPGGAVTAVPSGSISNCQNGSGTCISPFATGTTVTLTAQNDSTHSFAGWSGDCTGTSTVCAVAMTGPKVLSANFGPVPVPGACGTAKDQAVGSPPVANLCLNGTTPSSVQSSGSMYSWTCSGIHTSSVVVNCTAPQIIAPVCGPAMTNGTPLAVTPSTQAELCAGGTAGTVSSANNAFSWTCTGINSTATAACTIGQQNVNGQCATPPAAAAAPTTGLCTLGSPTAVNSPTLVSGVAAGSFTWGCNGLGATGTSTAPGACSTPKIVDGACGSATGSTVASAPSQNLCVAGTTLLTSVNGTGPWTWGCHGANNGTDTAANACTASLQTSGGSANSGLYIPPGTTGLYVVDPASGSTSTFVPGCINGGTVNCQNNYAYTSGATIVKLVAGTAIAIRYTSTATSNLVKKFWYMTGWDGGNVGANTLISLSTTPGDFAPANSSCTAAGSAALAIGTGPLRCLITPSTHYYLNIKVTSECSINGCRFRLDENTDFVDGFQ